MTLTVSLDSGNLGGRRSTVKDGVVTGTSVPKNPNSFMASEREYGDFEFDYEFMVDERLNSGVQIPLAQPA